MVLSPVCPLVIPQKTDYAQNDADSILFPMKIKILIVNDKKTEGLIKELKIFAQSCHTEQQTEQQKPEK